MKDFDIVLHSQDHHKTKTDQIVPRTISGNKIKLYALLILFH